jgi:hypothetical protein
MNVLTGLFVLLPSFLAIPSFPVVVHSGNAAWVELPHLDDYAEQGLPDFNQWQDDGWRSNLWGYTWCGVVAAADILWYLDSQHECGFYGDGVNLWNLVPKNYVWFEGTYPTAIVFLDDHLSSVPHALIECLADACGTDTWGKLYGLAGNTADSMEIGLQIWIESHGLSWYYEVDHVVKPTFSEIMTAVENEWGIILLGEGLYPILQMITPHWVAVQGYQVSPKQLLISDPFWDGSMQTSDPTEHNDAQCVVHEIRDVVELSSHWRAHCKLQAMLWDRNGHCMVDGYLTHAIIIRPK